MEPWQKPNDLDTNGKKFLLVMLAVVIVIMGWYVLAAILVGGN